MRLTSLILYALVGSRLACAQAQNAVEIIVPTESDRTALPIKPPSYPLNTTEDARNSTPPPRFEIKAPNGAPNVLIILIDDFGFAQSAHSAAPFTCQQWSVSLRVA